MRIVIGNLKGGSGKTATAVHVALGLSREGRTLLVDCDPEQPMALEWSEEAEDWPADRCTVIHCATRDLGRRVRPMLDDYEHVVFDTGAKNRSLLLQALGLADDLVIVTKPTGSDIPELPKVLEIAAEADGLSPVNVMVLLTMVRPSSSAEQAREVLGQWGVPVLATQIRLLRRYEDARGTVPDELGDYEWLIKELKEEAAA